MSNRHLPMHKRCSLVASGLAGLAGLAIFIMLLSSIAGIGMVA